MRKSISPVERLSLTLRYLATGKERQFAIKYLSFILIHVKDIPCIHISYKMNQLFYIYRRKLQVIIILVSQSRTNSVSDYS